MMLIIIIMANEICDNNNDDDDYNYDARTARSGTRSGDSDAYVICDTLNGCTYNNNNNNKYQSW